MFTGIITHLGKIKKKLNDSFIIDADISLTRKLEEGMSISVDGVCLTVLQKPVGREFAVEVMPETWKRSMLGTLTKNDIVNLELPVTTKALLSSSPAQNYLDVKDRGLLVIQKLQGKSASTAIALQKQSVTLMPEAEAFLSGHLVQGHVDGIGVIKKIVNEGNSRLLTIAVDAKLSRYIVEKGFIAVNGISLTVIDVTDNYFTVGIIPFTWKHTMLHTIHEGSQVNIEIDILAKYVEKIYGRR